MDNDSSTDPGERIGETLFRKGEIEKRHIENILIRQEHGDKRKFGQIAIALKYASRSTVLSYLKELKKNRKRKDEPQGTGQTGQ